MSKYIIGQNVIGKITSVKPYALFLVFPNGSKGLLHISEISDSYIKDIEKYGSIDDELKVKVIDIDSKNGFLRVSLKKVEEDERYSTHVNNSKNTNFKVGDDDFKILKEKLPNWIEDQLKIIEGDKQNEI